jgi:hypothetical protein
MAKNILTSWSETLRWIVFFAAVGPLFLLLWEAVHGLRSLAFELWQDPKIRADVIGFYGNIVGSFLGGALSVGGAIWAVNHQLNRNRETASKQSRAKISALTRHFASVAKQDLETMKAAGHAAHYMPAEEAFRIHGKNILATYQLSDAMHRDLAQADSDVYACVCDVEIARNLLRISVRGNPSPPDWTVGDHLCNLAGHWILLLLAIQKMDLLNRDGEAAIREFEYMRKFFAPFAADIQRQRDVLARNLSLPDPLSTGQGSR